MSPLDSYTVILGGARGIQQIAELDFATVETIGPVQYFFL